MNPKLVLALTGASGAPYAIRLLEVLLATGRDVHLCISESGKAVLEQELGLVVNLDRFNQDALLPNFDQIDADQTLRLLRNEAGVSSGASNVFSSMGKEMGRVTYHHYKNMMAPIASGSCLTEGMVICPCSGSTLSAIAHGSSSNLIQRAADVHLKERRKLILVPRETPLSIVNLDNMRKCVEAGAIVLPAMPGFYHEPKSVQDLVDFIVGRICDQLGIQNALISRWGENKRPTR